MPEDKDKNQKFKAVTEEVLPEPEPQVPESQPTGLAVRETDNVDLNAKVSEKGVFLKIFLVTFFATLLAFALAGGIYVYLTGMKGNTPVVSKTPQPTEIPLASATPVASPSANVDLSTFKVSVLNGNGGIGVASAAKSVIEKIGFKVSYIGNADNFNFTNTLIQATSSVSADVVAKVNAALSAANYSTAIGDPLPASSSYDIVVTVGSK